MADDFNAGIMHRYNATGKKQMTLTEEQMQEIKEVFDIYDTDGSGAVEDKEMKVLMTAPGFGNVSREDTVAMMMSVDKNGSGTMGMYEFIEMMQPLILARNQKDEILKSFELFASGEKISYSELRELADELGETFTDQELQDMIDDADDDGDALVGPEEFLKVMRRTQLWDS
mmetsp:Transcript_9138/g.16699  ORF Transcript_9138/g.16699 Transcript_9138/m.16699 type:complete len:172 (+) Transcript_9138:65-580(+)